MNAAHAVGRLSEDRQSPLPKRLCMTPDEGAARHIRDLAMRFSLGWNVSLIIQSPLPKRLSMQALASSRTKRMKTKIRKKYGFFAEEFIAEELAAKPSYYRGFSAIFYDEWEEYEREWQSWPTPAEALGRMVVAGIPKSNPKLEEMQRRKAELRAKALQRTPEMLALQEAARRKREADEAAPGATRSGSCAQTEMKTRFFIERLTNEKENHHVDPPPALPVVADAGRPPPF